MAVQDNHLSRFKRGVERRAQGRITERFEQAVDGALCDEARPGRLVSVSRDEDDRNFLPPQDQLA
jgi:hypothetical protein